MRKAVRVIVVKDDALLVMHRNKFGQQYYTLVGGAIKPNESPLMAIDREVREETSLLVTNPRFVFMEEAGEPYGTQYVYLCEYTGGDAMLDPDSDEAKIHALGSNLYTPTWLPVRELPNVPFVSGSLQNAIIHGLLHGFPDKPMLLM